MLNGYEWQYKFSVKRKAIWRKTDLAKMLSQVMTIGAVSLVIMGCNGGSGIDEGGQGGESTSFR
ncbi:hypothetical protein [Vibrio methylphosphonaticus]|uniref:hypothetical protein n=1 Tax=Vibrio methylphosphonaticus TaxID=2946866 RepID=UPI002029DF39|nr:hypothetical protein [Vibrio methylphosphonaticus]MCL9774047.1 hypothetical protein [Vibrio methylphosphonaticus]